MNDDLYEPLDPEQDANLEASIGRAGVRDPVLVSSLSGRVLAGKNRIRLATKLGVPYETKVVQCDTELDELLVEIEENPQRRIRQERRDQIVGQLRAAGWSDRRIAVHLGVTPMTVQRSSSPPVTNVTGGELTHTTGLDGKPYPRKATPNELPVRRAHVVRLWEDGWGRDQIAAALGVSNGTVDKDLVAGNVELRGKGTRPPRAGETPPTIEWRTESVAPKPRVKKPKPVKLPEPRTEPRPPVPDHKNPGSAVARIHQTRKWFDESRWALGACHELNSAEAYADTEWLEEYRRVTQSLADDFARLRRLADDREFRNAQIRQDDGAAPPVRLHVVQS